MRFTVISSVLLFSVILIVNCVSSQPNDVASKRAPVTDPDPTHTSETKTDGWNTVRNDVNGIGIGSKYDDIVKIFGKPLSTRIDGENACGGKRTILAYDGITFDLDGDGSERIVVKIEITSTNWLINPGIRVGTSVEEVRSLMKDHGRLDSSNTEIGYGDGDGYLTFQLKNGIVTKIRRSLNMC